MKDLVPLHGMLILRTGSGGGRFGSLIGQFWKHNAHTASLCIF